MKIKLNMIKAVAICAAALTTAIYSACTPDEVGDGNGLDSPNLTAAFTVTPVNGKSNTYVVKAQPAGLIGVKWDLGDGSTSAKTVDTVFYPDADIYKITLTAIGAGGVQKTASQEVNVATSDPIRGNLLQGGKMQEGDQDKWKILNLSATPLTLTFADGKLNFAGGGYNHTGVYQEVQVEANKKYKVDMVVSGSGASDTWFEVYVGQAAPVQGSDYNDGGIRLGLNTWNGCGKSPFSGKLSSMSCAGNGGGVVSFPNAGKAYVVIRTGGGNLGETGISITKVELRPVVE